MIDYEEKGHRRLLLTLNGEPWKTVHTGIFGKPPKLPATEEEWPELEIKMAKRFVLDRLSYRNYPGSILRQKLKERLVSNEAIDQALIECAPYFNDASWTESFVAHEIQKGRGPRLIAHKLRGKGLQNELIENALIPAYETQAEQIETLKEKYSPQALIRRGFDTELVLHAYS